MNPALRFPAAIAVIALAAVVGFAFPAMEDSTALDTASWLSPFIVSLVFVGIRMSHLGILAQLLLAIGFGILAFAIGIVLSLIIIYPHLYAAGPHDGLRNLNGSCDIYTAIVAPILTCALITIFTSPSHDSWSSGTESSSSTDYSSHPLIKWLLTTIGGIVVAIATAAILKFLKLK